VCSDFGRYFVGEEMLVSVWKMQLGWTDGETGSEPELLGWLDNEVKRDVSVNNSQSGQK
jgi:hypothetical protein